MFVDTSAIVSCICNEEQKSNIVRALNTSVAKFSSPMVRLESSIVIAQRMDITTTLADELFDNFITESKIVIIELTDAIGKLAVEAYGQFGKSRHPAKLNLADCFSYAAAKFLKVPILFIGNDFSKTDLKSAL
jgi:ribonuclease VapC